MIELFFMSLTVVAIADTARGRGASPWLFGSMGMIGWLLLHLAMPATAEYRNALRGGALMAVEFGLAFVPWGWLGLVLLYVRLVPGRSHAQPRGRWKCAECGWLNEAVVFKCEACKREWASSPLGNHPPPPLAPAGPDAAPEADSCRKEYHPERSLTPFVEIKVWKVALLTTATCGAYEVVWFYKQWRRVARRTGQDIWPVARALFPPVWAYSLFRRMNEGQAQSPIRAGTLALLYVLFHLTAALPGPF